MVKRKNKIVFNPKTKKKWISCWFAYKKEYSILLQEDLVINIYIRSLLFNSKLNNFISVRFYRLNFIFVIDVFFFGSLFSAKKKILLFIENINFFFNKNIYLTFSKLSLFNLSYAGFHVAFKIAKLIEKRIKFRSKVIKLLLKKIKRNCKGIYIQCAGRLNNETIARIDKLYLGSNPLHTINLLISYGQVIANTNKGLQCIKVWINKKSYVIPKKNKI